MALSQKHSGKILVPWYNSHEWRYVYSLIYSESSTECDKMKAIEILRVWKIRMPTLFSGLEGTLIILNAKLQNVTAFTQTDLSTFYGLAIMRFLNLCAAYSDQQGTFFRVAKEKNLPEWLVNIRHDLAHSQKQLSPYMLRKGLEYCFQWLKREYWERQDQVISDLEAPNSVTENIKKMRTYCEFVSARISGEKLSSHIIDFLKEIQANTKSDIDIVLQKLINKVDDNKLFIEEIPKLIIKEGYLFTVPLDDNEENIPSPYIIGWQPLIQYMQINNILMKFVRNLHEICYNNKDVYTQAISSLWLNEIFKGILKAKGLLYENESTPILDLHNVENLLLELRALFNETIEEPHKYFQKYSTMLMTSCEYNENFIKHINNLLINYFEPRGKLILEDDDPFTVQKINELLKSNIFEISSSKEELLNQSSHGNNSEFTSNGCLRIEDTLIYESCPIGVLPLQNRNLNNTIFF